MQSKEEDQPPQEHREETEVIQHSETQEQENDPNLNNVDKAVIPLQESGELKSTDKCLVTAKREKYTQRITNLQDLILDIRQKLKEEKEWWDTQIEELKMKVLDYSPDYLDYCSSPKNSVTLDVQAQLLESPRANSVFNFALDNKQTMDYERKLKCYQEALTLAQFEKHQNMKRQLAAHAYKKKLLEIEQLCNEELSRIQQNACMLEPLNKLASEWKLSSTEPTSQSMWKGDSFFTPHSEKFPTNLCDMNCTINEDCSLGFYTEASKGDMTTCLNLISGHHSSLTDALGQNNKNSVNDASVETFSTDSKQQKAELEIGEEHY